MMKVGTLALQQTRVSYLSLISLYDACKLEICSSNIWGEYKLLLHSDFEPLIHFIRVLEVPRSPVDGLFDKLAVLCWIWGSHSSNYEEHCLQGYNSV
jgi:hypothetical protein